MAQRILGLSWFYVFVDFLDAHFEKGLHILKFLTRMKNTFSRVFLIWLSILKVLLGGVAVKFLAAVQYRISFRFDFNYS